MSQLPASYRRLEERYRAVFEAYERLGRQAAEAGPLDEGTRELVRLGMAAAAGSEGAVRSHVHRALEAGVSREAIEHALLLGVTTLGLPRTMAALSWAWEAMGENG